MIDQSEFQCVYNHCIYDPQLDTYRNYNEILEIGSDYSKYESYGNYQLDSALRLPENKQITAWQFHVLYQTYKPTLDYIIKNHKAQQLKVYDKVFIDNYIYEEPIPEITWTLETGVDTICGYPCNKASANFRGRTWTAWYSEIPINNGPWKFGNLPGLILKVEDSKGEHKFEAIGFKQDKVEFGIEERDYFKTTREKFNHALLDYKNNAWKAYAAAQLTPKNEDGTPTVIPKRKLFFNPIELE